LKKHKPLFDEGCSKLLDQREKARVQWLQDPGKINLDNLNNVRCETTRHYMNKKKEYLKDRIDELRMNSKNRNIACILKLINIYDEYISYFNIKTTGHAMK
jgi:hypothetical protein